MNLNKLLVNFGLMDLLKRLYPKEKGRLSPLTRERQEFEKEVKEQFQKLKDKGLGISVFTL